MPGIKVRAFVMVFRVHACLTALILTASNGLWEVRRGIVARLQVWHTPRAASFEIAGPALQNVRQLISLANAEFRRGSTQRAGPSARGATPRGIEANMRVRLVALRA